MKPLSFDSVKASVLKKGYRWFPDKPMIIGIRTESGLPNVFDDYFLLCQEYKNKAFVGLMCTTEPGTFYLQRPMNVIGTAILVPGQYIDVWQLGIHGAGKKTAHEALRQCGTFKVWRDNNKDAILDYSGPILDARVGSFIDGHSSGILKHIPSRIDKWSAGCQVVQNYELFVQRIINEIKDYLKKYKLPYSTKLTYTLLEEKDLI